MSSAAIVRIALDIVVPVPRTRWCFVTVECADGVTGTGEATLQSHEAALLTRARSLLPGLVGCPANPADISRRRPVDLPEAALLSALSHAFWDIAAQREGRPLCDTLGPVVRRDVPVYANINRRTRDRTPAGFAASASVALAAGFSAVKIAPFDEVTAEMRRDGTEQPAMQNGLERIAAVRDCIGPDVDLMVDCHWRFSPVGAADAIDALVPLGLYWFECPLPETEEMLADITRLRHRANAAGMLLAGCETEIGLEGFERFVAAGAYDVVMPDIKYVGSVDEMLALARRLDGSGIAFSPHNPSGPVSHAASLHCCAVAHSMDRLEMQFDETEVFESLVSDAIPLPQGGLAALPAGPGLGVRLDSGVLEAHRRVGLVFP